MSASLKGGTPVVYTGTASATAARTFVLDKKGNACFSRALAIQNTGGAGDDLLVSFDDGTTFITITPLQGRDFVITVTSFVTKSSGASGCTWEAVATTAS